ncbi:MAG: transcription-repair coupling factor [Parachlamydiaceae bacterium]|nr:transcription-repair coupling factor [Parachlamydiaceae bacterium]
MLQRLLEGERVQQLQASLQRGDTVLIEELWNAPKALIAALAQKSTGKHILILTGGSVEETRLFHDFTFFTDVKVFDFPAWETLPSESIAPSPDTVGERYQLLQRLISDTIPCIIISNLQACLQRLLPPQSFTELYLSLKIGEVLPFQPLIARLNAMGYKRSAVASDKGEFAVRGGIIDIFPVSLPDPYRLEFWGDELESIRIYDPIGQKTIRRVEAVQITPAQELELLKGQPKLSSLLDYLGNKVIVVFDDLLALEDRYASLIAMCGSPKGSFSSIESLLDQMEPLQKLFWPQQHIEELSPVKREAPKPKVDPKNHFLQPLSFELFNRKFKASRWQHAFLPITTFLVPTLEESSGHELLSSLNQWHSSDLEVHFLCSSDLEKENLEKKILESQIALPKHTHFTLGYLSSGIAIPDENLLLFPVTEITQRFKIRRQKHRSTYHTAPLETFDLQPGELVVHFNQGIGRYLGLERRTDHLGIETEFLVVEYSENGKLYVPLSQAHLVTKYIGANEESPKLHGLGEGRWKRTREKTEQAILGYALELLELYAKRQLAARALYKPDGPDMLAFEEDFPYVETEDQLGAIAAIKADLLSEKCMDRLVCGDVGYGKTEVAMRAAFKAVIDGGRQVAVLVPTTVLAMQHYESFIERMSNFPVTVGVLSRFRSAKEIKETLKGAASGAIDIVIGTHRIISEDVIFKELGLIIIDEEQRFGVKAKEALKKLKVGVDCLTLSATPIPRTLYMSLIGARDLSVINTPPQDRLPITTVITDASEEAFKTAIARELARDGQAYIIHNRVETIYEMGNRVKKLFPQANIVICHGQMDSDDIDQVFHAFKSGQADILIATTIIENGIDIPNANTILIDRADQFGLADLYQLRGRVGRWNRRAYAYFLVRSMRGMAELSRKRLNALAESSGYGGGMKVAMRDLELRGAGNVLGTEQSGQVASIGFHLYCKLLKKAVQRLQGSATPALPCETKLEFPFDARLPEEYVSETNLRIEIYQRLGEVETFTDIDTIWEEVRDRFGAPPPAALWLYHLTRIRLYASTKSYISLKLDKNGLLTEKMVRKDKVMKRFMIGQPKTPKDFETALFKVL